MPSSSAAEPTRTGQPILPETDNPDTAPFWAATLEHRLVVQRCDACGLERFPPHPFCAGCRSSAVSWVDAGDTGTVWSHAIVHPPTLPAYEEFAPYMTAIVQLDRFPHLRIVGNIVTGPGAGLSNPPEGVTIGAPVRVVFDDVAEDVSLPRWRLNH